jgi:hypothetical protein
MSSVKDKKNFSTILYPWDCTIHNPILVKHIESEDAYRRDSEMYEHIRSTIEELLNETTVQSRLDIVNFWFQLGLKTLNRELFYEELEIFFRDNRWNNVFDTKEQGQFFMKRILSQRELYDLEIN